MLLSLLLLLLKRNVVARERRAFLPVFATLVRNGKVLVFTSEQLTSRRPDLRDFWFSHHPACVRVNSRACAGRERKRDLSTRTCAPKASERARVRQGTLINFETDDARSRALVLLEEENRYDCGRRIAAMRAPSPRSQEINPG